MTIPMLNVLWMCYFFAKLIYMAERRDAQSTFQIRSMQDLYDETSGRTDTAHRHDYYTALLIDQASGTHYIDYSAYTFGNHELHLISPGQVHQVALNARPSGWVLTFTDGFLAENNISSQFISDLSLFESFGHCPPISLHANHFEKLLQFVDEMERCSTSDSAFRMSATGAWLQLFLIQCHESLSNHHSGVSNDQQTICLWRDFKTLVDNHHKEWHKVGDYAAQMHITPRHLSKTVKALTGTSAKEVIRDRLILEAKRLLLHSGMSIKEIAFVLGFEQSMHFSAFFKKNADYSPSTYRQQKRRT